MSEVTQTATGEAARTACYARQFLPRLCAHSRDCPGRYHCARCASGRLFSGSGRPCWPASSPCSGCVWQSVATAPALRFAWYEPVAIRRCNEPRNLRPGYGGSCGAMCHQAAAAARRSPCWMPAPLCSKCRRPAAPRWPLRASLGWRRCCIPCTSCRAVKVGATAIAAPWPASAFCLATSWDTCNSKGAERHDCAQQLARESGVPSWQHDGWHGMCPSACRAARCAGQKRDEPGPSQRHPPLDPAQPSTSAAGAAAAAAAKPLGHAAAATPAAAVARRLSGVRCVTLSLPGVLLEESSPDELEESASVRAVAAGKPPPAASLSLPGMAHRCAPCQPPPLMLARAACCACRHGCGSSCWQSGRYTAAAAWPPPWCRPAEGGCQRGQRLPHVPRQRRRR